MPENTHPRDTVSVVITLDGEIAFVYADLIAPDLLALGEATIRRASHVEPDGIMWTADMSPVNGPVLGPFPTRAAALAAEVAWLHAHALGLAAGADESEESADDEAGYEFAPAEYDPATAASDGG